MVRKQISFLCCELYPLFLAFLIRLLVTGCPKINLNGKLNPHLSWILKKHQASTVLPLIKSLCQGLFTYKIRHSLAELVGKNRKEFVKTVIKIIKIISGFLVVCRKLGYAFVDVYTSVFVKFFYVVRLPVSCITIGHLSHSSLSQVS